MKHTYHEGRCTQGARPL